MTSYRLDQDEQGRPVLWTERLRLRLPAMKDLSPGFRFWSSERSHMMGGPWSRDQTRDAFHDLLDQWQRHGFSLFSVTLHGSDTAIGGIGPFFPFKHREPELGWSLWRLADEGKGLAYEAAAAARDWFFAHSGHKTAVSYTDPANARSHRLCERLGGVVDPQAWCPDAEPTLTYRHYAPGHAPADLSRGALA